jgi:hypothetical protein
VRHNARMNADELTALAQAAAPQACDRCQALPCKGWEAVPGGYDASHLRRVGGLRDEDDGRELTLEEHHPGGTHSWSADAPIALGWFPYNRCDVWQCTRCARAYLRYTEYGGYYTEARIRELQAALITATPPPPSA